MQLKVNIFIGSNSLGVEIARRVRKTTYGRISLSFRSLWCCAMLEVYLITVQLRCVQRPSSSFKCHEGCKETIGDWTEIQSNQLTSKWNLRVTRSVAGSNSNPPSSTQKETHTHTKVRVLRRSKLWLKEKMLEKSFTQDADMCFGHLKGVDSPPPQLSGEPPQGPTIAFQLERLKLKDLDVWKKTSKNNVQISSFHTISLGIPGPNRTLPFFR